LFLSNLKARILTSNSRCNKQDQALTFYKDKWQIGTKFKAMKSSGFNLVDTHLTDLERLSMLIAVVAIAFIWAYLADIEKHENF